MTAKTRIEVAAHPDINLRMRMDPLEFKIGGEASFALVTGDIHFRVDEIPVNVAIPFLHRRVVLGSIGPFGVHVRPFEAQVRAFGLDAQGVLGREGGELELHGTGHCKAEIEVSGKLPEALVKAAMKTITEE
jgi:hypothetical protein